MSWVPEGAGWAGTAVFAASYSCKDSIKIRRVQAAAAAGWVGYGLLIHSLPVVAANFLVLTLALYTAWRERRLVGSGE